MGTNYMNDNLNCGGKRKIILLLVSYTVMFAVIAAGVFFWFFSNGKTFINEYDALDQGYFWTVELKDNIHSFLSGNGYPQWHWYKGTGMESKSPTDIFALIAIAFPDSMLDIGYTVAVIVRLYCSGLAFIAFAKEVKLSNYQALMGAVCYVFSTWIIDVSLIQAQFINITVILPLVIAGVDRIYKGKSPAVFMITVAWAMCNSIYLGYMVGICTVLYILLRYFAYCEKFSIKEYLVYIAKFMGYGIVGIAVSMAVTITTIGTLMGASTGGEAVSYSFFKGTDYVCNLMNVFVSEGFAFRYGDIGLPVLGMLVMAVAFRYFSMKKTGLIMSIILTIMMLFPFFSSMFNGFGYVTSRWFFLLVFFLAWTAADMFDLNRLAETKNLIIMGFWLCVMVGGTLGLAYFDINSDYSRERFLFICINMLAAAVILAVIALGKKAIVHLRVRQSIIALITVVTLIAGWNISFSKISIDYMSVGQMEKDLAKSTQRAGRDIDDDGFYRIDQVSWLNVFNRMDQPDNENLYWKTNSLYLYDSKIPAKLQDFNRLLGNMYSYSKRVYVLSNNNRIGLDFLYGVKYFLGNDSMAETTAADGCAGYGFEKYKVIDGVNVFRNKYDSGLGFTYDKVISESEFLKLSRLAREQALLQAMVVSDEYLKNVSESQIVDASEIQVDINKVPYTICGAQDAEVKDNTINVINDRGYIDINVANVKNSQLMVSFDNLKRIGAGGQDIGDFCFSAATAQKKSVANNKKNNQTISGIEDYDLNVGCYDKFSGKIRIKFEKAGKYTFDKFYVSAMSTSNYDKFAAERLTGKYNITSYNDNEVRGTVDAKDTEFVYFSVPFNNNWNIFVDGKKAEKITDANLAFMAVKVDKGKHDIKLVYKSADRTAAYVISLSGIALVILISIMHIMMRNRKRGKHEEGNNLRNI